MFMGVGGGGGGEKFVHARTLHAQGPLKWPGPRCIKTMATLQLMVSLQTMVTIIDFLNLIGYGAVLLW